MKPQLYVTVLLLIVGTCECVYVYSSFYAPLFNPRIVNYRVDATFDPGAGKRYRENYEKNYGVRGERLVLDLGNGRGPNEVPLDENVGSVKFYYTYPGAPQDNSINDK